jgi:hypothetical protein
MADMQLPERAARLAAFATLGTLGTTQDLARAAIESIADAGPDLELVAEETLSLVAVATVRAAEVGLRDHPDVAAAVLPTLLDLPFSYRDYLIGGAMIAQKDASLLDANEEIYQRLQRKQDFYTAHLPEGQFPGDRALQDKLPLWMGRISPPGLPETPSDRLDRLDVRATLVTHLKLVLAFAKKGSLGG